MLNNWKYHIKKVRVIFGEIQDVVVDLRKGSCTFGQWESVILSGTNHKIFYFPAGFAHGFKVLSENALVSYKCIGAYNKETDTGIRWDDKDLNIEWNDLGRKCIVSNKDQKLMSFYEFKRNYERL